MSDSPMFWRIVRRLITANYGRLFVILLALGAGAAITSALLNLQIDAKRRLTTEFRALGANVIVAPRDANANSGGGRLEQRLVSELPTENSGKPVPAVEFLYVIGEVAKTGEIHHEAAVIAGTEGQGLTQVRPGRRTEYSPGLEKDPAACEVGAKAATQFKVHAGDSLHLRYQGREATCKVFAVVATGGAEDTQIFTTLATAQSLADLPARISLVQLSVTGTPDSIQRFIAALAQVIAPHLDRDPMPRLLFSAHGLPLRIVAQGDLYPQEIERTARAAVGALARPGLDWRICYQSRVGPLKWLGPSVDEELHRAAKDGVAVVVAPISFVSEHSETLVELDCDYRKIADACGVPGYERAPTVGTHPEFIAALATLVGKADAEAERLAAIAENSR